MSMYQYIIVRSVLSLFNSFCHLFDLVSGNKSLTIRIDNYSCMDRAKMARKKKKKKDEYFLFRTLNR